MRLYPTRSTSNDPEMIARRRPKGLMLTCRHGANKPSELARLSDWSIGKHRATSDNRPLAKGAFAKYSGRLELISQFIDPREPLAVSDKQPNARREFLRRAAA